MTKRLQLKTNLNCSACVAAVKPYLDGDPSIAHWDVDTATSDKILTVEGESIAEETVNAIVTRAGFKVLGEAHPAKALLEEKRAEPASKTTYYPLLLLFAFLVGIVGLVELQSGELMWQRTMKNFMGAFFIAFAFFKLLDLRGFADSYRMYDIIARRIPIYGYVYPFIELMLGVAYVTGFKPVATNLATLVVMTVSSLGVIQSLLAKRKIRCACLGTVFDLPMSTVTLVEDGTMVVMAAAMLLSGQR